jgi:hypothetical protein
LKEPSTDHMQTFHHLNYKKKSCFTLGKAWSLGSPIILGVYTLRLPLWRLWPLN